MENISATPSKRPSPQFIQSIQAGLRYWQQKTREMGTDQVHWLDKRRQNLYQAVLFGLKTAETWEDTATVLLQTFNFVEWGGYSYEWIPVLEQALAYAPDDDSVWYGRLQNSLGQLYRLAGHPDQAVAQHEKALQQAQKLKDKELEMRAYMALSEAYLAQRAVPQAKEYGLLGLELAKVLPGVESQEATALKTMGSIASFLGNWAEAIEYQQRSAQLWRVQNNPVYVARTLNDIGITYTRSGDFALAQAAYEEAAAILQPTLNEVDKARIYLNLGVLHYQQKQWPEAAAAFLQINNTALRERQETHFLAKLHNNLGNVYLKMAEWEPALENLKIAADTFRKMNDKLELANSLGTMAEVYVKMLEKEQVVLCYEEAITLLKQFPESHWGQNLLATYSADYHAFLEKNY